MKVHLTDVAQARRPGRVFLVVTWPWAFDGHLTEGGQREDSPRIFCEIPPGYAFDGHWMRGSLEAAW